MGRGTGLVLVRADRRLRMEWLRWEEVMMLEVMGKIGIVLR